MNKRLDTDQPTRKTVGEIAFLIGFSAGLVVLLLGIVGSFVRRPR